DFHRPLPSVSCKRACALAHQSVSRGVAITQSLSAHRCVNSRCSRSASSSNPIQRNLRMRLTRSFALLSRSAASSCLGCSSVIGITLLPHLLLFGFAGCAHCNVVTSQLGLPIDRAPLAGANRAGPARLLALTYWLACARGLPCAAPYCGGKLASRLRFPKPLRAVPRCVAARAM